MKNLKHLKTTMKFKNLDNVFCNPKWIDPSCSQVDSNHLEIGRKKVIAIFKKCVLIFH